MGVVFDTEEQKEMPKFDKEIDVEETKRAPLDVYYEASKAVCKIIIKENNHFATGFFLHDASKNKWLLTNNHAISHQTLDSNKTIILEIYDKRKFIFKLNRSNVYNRFLEDPLDVTIIPINGLTDLSNCVKFLEIDLNYTKGFNTYLNADIFALGYPFGNNVEVSKGKIIKISQNEFGHNCDTNHGSPGSPIILASNLNVIGIHKAGNNNDKINVGTFIGNIINQIMKKQIITDNIAYYNKISQIKYNNLNYRGINKKTNIVQSNNEINNKINENNYIVAEFFINDLYKHRDIQIINSYENHKRNRGELNFVEDLRNEKEIKACKIQVEGKIIQFSYTYKFYAPGKFKIIYTFQKYPKSLCDLFSNCNQLVNLDLSNFNTQNVTSMSGIFCYCRSLTNIDLSNVNTQNVTDMSGMFCYCKSLTNINVSNFNTQKVTDMSGMFSDCSSLDNINVSNFNTQNVTSMSYMFYGCSSLKNLDLSNFNTQNVTHMRGMLYECSSLTNINLSNFNTEKTIDMSYMFCGCSSLKNLDLSNFNIKNISEEDNYELIVRECYNLDLSNIICHDEKLLKVFSYDLKAIYSPTKIVPVF